ncbi:hypothetical protein HanPSC8_Chr12g0524671 [Helianthus annuus]|nr:hypothetical protein HanPSC8_Chr12g0524671 [Helianthus annuus]
MQRDGRSFREVLGNSLASAEVASGGGSYVAGKSVIVPDRMAAFNEVVGLAVVGRTVDLETLVDLDKLMRIGKVPFSKIQYLGGLSTLITFADGDSMGSFLKARVIWGTWFSKLEEWKGQSLPLERVAWLNLHGIPLHLFCEEVVSIVGDLFGKVLHIPKCLDDNHDLSVVSVGVLAGEASRIGEAVTIGWKGRNFRIWVEEEMEAWVPDYLNYGSDECPASSSDSPVMSSPVGVVNVEGSKSVGSQGEMEESLVGDVRCSHADVGNREEEREKSGEGGGFVGGPEVSRKVDSLFPTFVVVGPSEFPAGDGSHVNPFK